jgi:hypothetical protein
MMPQLNRPLPCLPILIKYRHPTCPLTRRGRRMTHVILVHRAHYSLCAEYGVRSPIP